MLITQIWGKRAVLCLLGLFWVVFPLAAQEKSGEKQPEINSAKSEKLDKKDLQEQMIKQEEKLPQSEEFLSREKAVPSKEPLPQMSPSDESLFVSDIDSEKAMESDLQKIILKDIRASYLMIRSMTIESDDESSTLEIAYDQDSSRDKLQVTANLIKNEMRAEIIIKTPLLQKKEELSLQGDDVFLEKVVLIPDKRLSTNLGNDSKLTFVSRIDFLVLRPIRWKVYQTPGILRIEFRPYLASDDDEAVTEKEDILFHAPAMEQVSQVLGESYFLEKKYENQIFSGGELTLLEGLNSNELDKKLIKMTDYSRGMSEEAIIYDMKDRYPSFGSLQYWKKHLSAVISNTSQFLKRERNDHPIMLQAPGFAFAYKRQGTANIYLGYGMQREMPFFYGKQGGLAPMDGFVRHDIQGGLVYKTQTPWTYSIQNNLNLGRSENLASPPKFGDRLTTFRYELGQGLLYKFVNGYAKLGSGMRVEAEELGTNETIKAYWSAVIGKSISKKLALKTEYLHEHVFLQDPPPIANRDIHKIRSELSYRPRPNMTLSPAMGTAFYRGEAFSSWIGGFSYVHKLNSRSQISAEYLTDVLIQPVTNFGSQSLNGDRPTVPLRNVLIRHQNISISYRHELDFRTSLTLTGAYSRERQVNVENSDEFDAYRVGIALNRKLMKDWELECKYALNYVNAYDLSDGLNGGGITRSDISNTEHSLYLRMIRYFNQ